MKLSTSLLLALLVTLPSWANAVAGLVHRIGVEEGDRVRAGQTVAVLDSGTGRIDLEVAAAATAEAQATLTEAQRQLSAARDIGPGFFPADEIRSRESALQVAQAHSLHRSQPGLPGQEAVASCLRPVAMTTVTTVCGLLPLVLMPGAGSELYRGVWVVVLAGLVDSGLVALFFLPAWLTICMKGMGRWAPGHPALPDTQHAA